MQASEQQLQAWMIGGLDGDAAAHTALLRALVPLLGAFFRRRLPGAAADVDDLIQETLLAIHEKRGTYDRGRPFTAWLYAVARYRLIDHCRRRRATSSTEDLAEILATEGFEAVLSAHLDVEQLLGSLSPKQARAIRDTHLEGLSVAEAAKNAALSESDIKVSVHRGLKALAARIRGSNRS